jgi:bacteriocin-like protein
MGTRDKSVQERPASPDPATAGDANGDVKTLTDEDLEAVSGGATLARACATGKHIPKVIITI